MPKMTTIDTLTKGPALQPFFRQGLILTKVMKQVFAIVIVSFVNR